MKLKSIELTNFKSFRGEHTFEFDRPPGLHFVEGKNLATPEVGANGAGKSSLFDAVYFAMFGKTSRGLRPGDIVSYGEKACLVTLQLEIRNKPISIVRGRSGSRNSLTVDGAETTQDSLNNHIGLSEELFAAALVRGQFSTMFFDLSAADQLRMMDDILQLELWTDASNKAKESVASNKEASLKLNETVSNAKGSLQAHETSLSTAEAMSEQHIAEEAQAIAEGKLELQRLEAAKADAISRLGDIETDESSDNKEIELYTNQRIELQNKIAEHHRTIDGFTRGLSDLRHQIVAYEQRKAHFAKFTAGVKCPTCEQIIAEEHTTACVSVANQEIARLEGEHTNLIKEPQKYNDAATKLEGEVSTLSIKLTELENSRRRLLTEVDNFKRLVNDCTNQVNTQTAILTDRKERKNPHLATIEDSKSRIMETKKTITLYETSMENHLQAHARSAFWVDGFKRVRLFVIDRAIMTLELEVNSNLVSLGLGDFVIKFATEKETKSGSISRKFDVMVARLDAPNEYRPIASWSGGEYQRLRLACELGLANMILSFRGVAANFEIFDEPTEHLSSEGVQSLLVSLKDRARDTGRQIWLIDHVSRQFPFDSITTIEKTESGSTIQ